MQKIPASHSTLCDLTTDAFGYFGWPTVARADNGTLWCVASGLRTGHVCPNGRTVLLRSGDGGQTWSTPRVIHDSPFDDRDAGILDAGDGRLLVAWFTSNALDRPSIVKRADDPDYPDRELYRAGFEWNRAFDPGRFTGSWLMHSDDDGATWSEPRAIDVSAPHGPVRLANGDLLYLGKSFGPNGRDFHTQQTPIRAMRSGDRGETFQALGEVPVAPKTDFRNYHEPHVAELPDGRLLGHIRIQNHSEHSLEPAGFKHFSIMQTTSDDGGATWSVPQPLGFPGSPPHLRVHSSGTLICTYSYRNGQGGSGQRVALSTDAGETWQHDRILRDDGPTVDLGYPSTVEMPDGSLLSVYYQQSSLENRCALLASAWSLPDA